MGFSSEWERHYAASGRGSLWPWSDVVSYVHRYAPPAGADTTVLEIGCGLGANIPFFSRLGVRYFAVEGSPTAVENILGRYPELRGRVVVGDFTRSLPFDFPFDLVVDRSALTHNPLAAIRDTIAMIHAGLKPGGRYIGIDWFSDLHGDLRFGSPAEDARTYTDFSQGQFAGVGRVHFSDADHLKTLFSRFEVEVLELKTVRRELPSDGRIFASWNLVAQKRLPA